MAQVRLKMEMLGAMTGVVPRLYHRWGPTCPPLMSRTTLTSDLRQQRFFLSEHRCWRGVEFFFPSAATTDLFPSWHLPPLLPSNTTSRRHCSFISAHLVALNPRIAGADAQASSPDCPVLGHCHVSTARRCAARLLHLPPDRHRGAQRALGQPVPLQPRSPPELHAAMDRRERVRSRAQRGQPPQPPQVPGLQGQDPPRGAA